MKIISRDGIGVHAMLTAARELEKFLDKHNVILGVLDGEALGGTDMDGVGALMAKADAGNRNALVVTVEQNPRVVVLGDGDPTPTPEPEPDHDVGGSGSHLIGGHCVCVGPCCNTSGGERCTCKRCSDPSHAHNGGS